MRCLSCNTYFKKNPFNSGLYCQDCLDAEEEASIPPLLDEDAEVEVQCIISPNGRTQPKFYE